MHCLCIQSFFDCSFVDFLELLSSTVAVLSRQIGNYNVLLQSCPVELYDVDRINWAARRQKRCCSMVICAKRSFGLRGPIARKIPQRFCSLPLGVARGKAQKCQISVELSMIVDDCTVCTSSLSHLHIAKVFSPPPRVSFSWRHWGHFTGSYEGTMGQGMTADGQGLSS